jgi:hypothetical protein
MSGGSKSRLSVPFSVLSHELMTGLVAVHCALSRTLSLFLTCFKPPSPHQLALKAQLHEKLRTEAPLRRSSIKSSADHRL